VNVPNKFAKVTYEAAIGSLDSKEIETLEESEVFKRKRQ